MAGNQKMLRADFLEALSGDWMPADSNRNLRLDLDLDTQIYCEVEGLLDEEEAESLAEGIQAEPNALTCFASLINEYAAREAVNPELPVVTPQRAAFRSAADDFLAAQSSSVGWAAALSAFDTAKKSGSDLWGDAREGLIELLSSRLQTAQPDFGFRDSEAEVADQIVGGVSTKQGGRYRLDFIAQPGRSPGKVPSDSIRLEVLTCNLPGTGGLIARLHSSDRSMLTERRISRRGTFEFSEIRSGRWLLSVASDQSINALGDCFVIDFDE